MTGRDLILYILSNGLENEPVCKDKKLIGFITISEAAEKLSVGVNTIYVWIANGQIDYIDLGNKYLIAEDCKLKQV